MSKYTKGPWEVMFEISTPFIGKKTTTGFIAISHVYSVTGNEEERIANAQLISAAPELLEACKKFEKIWTTSEDHVDLIKNLIDSGFVKEIKQAIAKAEGFGKPFV